MDDQRINTTAKTPVVVSVSTASRSRWAYRRWRSSCMTIQSKPFLIGYLMDNYHAPFRALIALAFPCRNSRYSHWTSLTSTTSLLTVLGFVCPAFRVLALWTPCGWLYLLRHELCLNASPPPLAQVHYSDGALDCQSERSLVQVSRSL
jgi:hypothetical protein